MTGTGQALGSAEVVPPTAFGSRRSADLRSALKTVVGGLGAYGKLFERVSALRHSEGITDSYVAEDIETALRYASFGYQVGRAGSFITEKGWPNQFSDARNPIRKWSYDSVESMTGRTPPFLRSA